MYIINIIVFVLSCFFVVRCSHSTALSDCALLHPFGQISNNSYYRENGCMLKCIVDGQMYGYRNLFNGFPCPEDPKHGCDVGFCNTLRKVDVGRIELEIIGAHLSAPANAFATLCIANTARDFVLPMTERYNCLEFTTKLVSNQADPVWHETFQDFLSRIYFYKETRIIIETWKKTNVSARKEYIDGFSINIHELFERELNNTQFVEHGISAKIQWIKIYSPYD